MILRDNIQNRLLFLEYLAKDNSMLKRVYMSADRHLSADIIPHDINEVLEFLLKRLFMGAPLLLTALSGASMLASAATTIRSNSYAKHSADEASAEAYERQNEQYEKYLSPSAQARQYAEAGVNPASALVQHASPGMGSVPQTQLPNLANPVPNFAETADIMTRSLSQLKDSQVKDEQIHNLMAQTIGQEFANGASEMLNELMEKYGDQKWAGEIRDLAASAFMKYAQGGLAEADFDLKNIIRLISNEELGMKREDAAQYSLKLAKLLKLLDAQTANEYAGASEHSANVINLKEQTKYQKMVNDIKAAGKTSEIESLIKQYKSSGRVADADAEKALNMLARYRHLNENDKNAAAEYLNYLFWFIKNEMPSLPIVPLLNVGK